MKTYGGSKSKAAYTFLTSPSEGHEPWLLGQWGNSSWYSLKRRPGEVQSQCGYFGRKQNTDPALTDYILLAPFTK
jgi:hypothetical protein